MRRAKLEYDTLLALQQMRESDPSTYLVYRRPSKNVWPIESVTLVTQFTLSRLARFERTLREWDGPLSAAIYLTDSTDIPLLEFYFTQPANRKAFANLALTIVKPDYSINELALLERLRYPINRLRNLALELAPSLYVVITDADFVPSPKMHHLLKTRGIPLIKYPTSATASPTLRRTAVVVSAFALAQSYNAPHPATPSQLSTLLASTPPQATLTDANAGHGPSSPSLLFETASPRLFSPREWPPKSWSYDVCYEPQWEPYYLLHRPSHPLYDERFTDQGGDKQSHTARLNALGYEFKVLRDVWFMHPPKGSDESDEIDKWPSARLVNPKDEEERNGAVVDPAHFSIAQSDENRFRYFQDFLPEMEREWGWNMRWAKGCGAIVVGERNFGRAVAGSMFGL